MGDGAVKSLFFGGDNTTRLFFLRAGFFPVSTVTEFHCDQIPNTASIRRLEKKHLLSGGYIINQ